MTTAFVIDGAYFLRRLRWCFPQTDLNDPRAISDSLWRMVLWHLHFLPGFAEQAGYQHGQFNYSESAHLYRVFFYDCPPLTKKMHRPISKLAIDLSKTPEARLRLAIHDELRQLRKVALRLGRLNDASEWRLTTAAVKRLRDGGDTRLTDDDFELDTKQKGVDMKLGLDVAAMSFKKQVRQIILIAGDADFVPATKLARREGIDVVLDPMGQRPAEDLFTNVDGVRSCRLGQPSL